MDTYHFHVFLESSRSVCDKKVLEEFEEVLAKLVVGYGMVEEGMAVVVEVGSHGDKLKFILRDLFKVLISVLELLSHPLNFLLDLFLDKPTQSIVLSDNPIRDNLFQRFRVNLEESRPEDKRMSDFLKFFLYGLQNLSISFFSSI
jgi:hypothetical protein